MTVSLPSPQPAGYADITSPFALDDEAFRALGHRLVDALGADLEALPESPVYQPLPDEVRRQIEETGLPAEGIEPEAVLEFFTQRVLMDQISPPGAERPAQDRRAEELECAI
jgi:hypothetical protein